MSHSLVSEKVLFEFSNYAEKHGIYNIFGELMENLLVDQPEDMIQYLAESLNKPSIKTYILSIPPFPNRKEIGTLIAKFMGHAYISSVDIVNQAIASGSSIGALSKSYADTNSLIPDEIMNALMKDALLAVRGKMGIILDGYPINIHQLNFLKRELLIFPFRAIYCSASDEKISEAFLNDFLTTKKAALRQADFESYIPILKRRIIEHKHTKNLFDHALLKNRVRFMNMDDYLSNDKLAGFSTKTPFDDLIDESALDGSFIGDILTFYHQKEKAKGPTSFRWIVTGYRTPGLKSTLVKLADRYSLIYVNPALAIKNAIELERIAQVPEAEYNNSLIVSSSEIATFIALRLQNADAKERGFIIDGFPNNIEDAMSLEKEWVSPSKFIYITPYKQRVNVPWLGHSKFTETNARPKDPLLEAFKKHYGNFFEELPSELPKQKAAHDTLPERLEQTFLTSNKRPKKMGKYSTLFVYGLNPETRARDLAYQFEYYGRLIRCDIPSPKNGGTPRKLYAFVEFMDSRDAERAYVEMHGRRFEGATLNVQWAKSNSRYDGDNRERGGDRRDDRGRKEFPSHGRGNFSNGGRAMDKERRRSASPHERKVEENKENVDQA